jgi:hypothetical protein
VRAGGADVVTAGHLSLACHRGSSGDVLRGGSGEVGGFLQQRLGLFGRSVACTEDSRAIAGEFMPASLAPYAISSTNERTNHRENVKNGTASTDRLAKNGYRCGFVLTFVRTL